MDVATDRKKPPVWLMLIIFTSFFLSVSIVLTILFKMPVSIPIPQFLGILVGIIFLSFGFYFLINALRALKISRAFGKDIYASKKESKLITTGVYSYTRNPLYFGSTMTFFGWLFIFQFTFILILTFLFVILFYFVAKWEERELLERFGDEYRKYKESTPFFIPYPKKKGE